MSIMRADTSYPAPFLMPGLRLWHSAADPNNDGTQPANGASVSSILNKAGWGQNGSGQATGANQPIYTTNAINGRSGLTFDGINDSYQNGATTIFALTSVYTFYAVIALSSSANTAQTIMSKGNSNTAPNFAFSINRSAANGKFSVYNGTGWVDSTNSITTTTDYNVVSATWDGATLKLYNNGTSLGITGTPGNLASSTQNLVIGGFGATSTLNFFSGKILEVLFYKASHTSNQVIDVTRFFGNYYGLNF